MTLALPLPRLPIRSFRALLLVLVMFYLAFHAVSGERGVLAWFKANRKLEISQLELQKTKDEQQSLARKVALLKSRSVDLDMLDEESRRVLGFAQPNEVVILREKK